MSLIQQRIGNLLNGISQRPDAQRPSSQGTIQRNALSHVTRGVMKRPPSQFIAKLTSDTEGWDNAFIHPINREADERYHVIITDDNLQVFDSITGAEIPVTCPNGLTYVTGDQAAGFRAVTVGDTTVIVNRGVKVRKNTDTAPDLVHEALVYVRQSDFSTLYTVSINGGDFTLRTVDMSDPTDRQQISTEAIAGDLFSLLSGGLTGFTLTQIGSTIHIVKADLSDFTLAVADGLGDQGLVGVKGTLQSFTDLPARASNGFVVEITGDVNTAKDNYFVKYDDLGLPGNAGVWRECPKPSSLIALDPATMPHALTLKGELPLKDTVMGRNYLGMFTTGLLQVDGGYQAWTALTGDVGLLATLPVFTYLTIAHNAGASFTTAADYDRVSILTQISASDAMKLLHEHAQVVLSVNGTPVQAREYDFKSVPTPLTLQTPGPTSSGDIISVALVYVSGARPADPEAFAELHFGQPLVHSITGLEVVVQDPIPMAYGATVESSTFGSIPKVPVGTTVGLGFSDGSTLVSYTYVVPDDAHSTPAAISEAIALLVDADANYTVADTTAVPFVVVRTDGVYPVAAGSAAAIFPADMFVNGSLNLGTELMTDDPWVGKILQNVTDGSQGTITHHGDTWIEIDSLTGGAFNVFSPGDVVRVVVDPEIGTHFVFAEIPWSKRGAGDVDVVPFPSFTDEIISDVFFYQNRLGLTSRENVVFSSSGNLFNLFRYTATDLRADDNIDVRSADAFVTIFDAAFVWSGGLFVKSDNSWFSVTGEPALTPSTVRLDPVGRYPSSKDPRPAVVGERAFYTREKNGQTQVFEITLQANSVTGVNSSTLSDDVSKDVPTYLPGAPLAIVGDNAENFLAVVTDGNSQRFIHIYTWYESGGNKVLSSWSHWELPADVTIAAIDLSDGILGLVLFTSEGEALLEQIDLSLVTLDAQPWGYEDHRWNPNDAPAPGEDEDAWVIYTPVDGMTPGFTVWRLPYAINTGTPVRVVDKASGRSYTTTRPDATHVKVVDIADDFTDLSAVDVWIGLFYEYEYVPTTFFNRTTEGQPETQGRLQLRWVDFAYNDTNAIDITRSLSDRTSITLTQLFSALKTGVVHFPVLGRNTDIAFSVKNSGPGGIALSAINWEADFSLRSRRV